MKDIRPADLIRKYYEGNPVAHEILLVHSRLVARKSLCVARHIRESGEYVNIDFIAQAAMLHDIGIIETFAPDLGCTGNHPYLAHGIEGSKILLQEDLPRHARVCERHTGVGLTAKEIKQQNLPLPERDLLPETLEEKIICYADLFFSKNRHDLTREKSATKVRRDLMLYGIEKGEIFDQWHTLFHPAGQDE